MKITYAIAALLANTNAIQVKSEIKAQQKAHQLEKNEAITTHMQDVDENMYMEDDQTVALKTRITTKAQGSEQCYFGIKRFTDGTDNTWQTFKNAHSTSALFEDQGFKADDTSLFQMSLVKDQGNAQGLESGVRSWRRPSQMSNDAPNLWGDKGIVPNGVAQGSVGDCWFLSAVSALAEVPERVKRVVWNDSYDKNGAFRFNFWVKNKWHSVNIDDRLPTNSAGQPFATRRSTNGAWWMPLMEKAYAKLDQNYERIIGGLGFEGLRTLTGMPTFYISHNYGTNATAVAESFTLLKALSEKNMPMTSPCCHNAKRGRGTGGLISGHAYTLLDVLELSTGVKLAKVRNPWNNEHYKGDWSDSSSKWTAALRKEAGQVTKNDGIFYLPFETYMKNYWGASISLYQSYKGFHQENIWLNTRTMIYSFNNPVAQEVYVQAETYSNRNFPRTCDPGNNAVLFLMDKSNKQIGTYAFVGGRGATGRGGFGLVGKIGQKLPAGDYKIYLMNQVYKTQFADLSVMWYFLDQKGTVKSA